MCTVQVLLITDGMRQEMHDHRIGALRPCGANVRRRLFDDEPRTAADPEAVLREFRERASREAALRWNFDFMKEKPLPGRYQWVPVRGSFANDAAAKIALGRADIPRDSSVRTAAEEAKPREGSNAKRNRTTPKQPKITEFMSQRKRRESGDIQPSKAKVRRMSSNFDAANDAAINRASSSADA